MHQIERQLAQNFLVFEAQDPPRGRCAKCDRSVRVQEVDGIGGILNQPPEPCLTPANGLFGLPPLDDDGRESDGKLHHLELMDAGRALLFVKQSHGSDDFS